MSIDWGKVAKNWWDAKPHPRAPSLTIGEFVTAVKLATMTKFGGHASPEDAALFWPEFKATGLSISDFQHALDRLAPISFAYHGRPPTMQEIVRLKDEPPAKANAYFADLPDKHYPWVTAATMIKHLQAAEPWSKQFLGRPPVKLEAAHLSASGEAPADYYARLANPLPPSNIQPSEWDTNSNPASRQRTPPLNFSATAASPTNSISSTAPPISTVRNQDRQPAGRPRPPI